MGSSIDPPRLPMIDLSLFELGDPWRDQVAAQIDAASSQFGFFYIVGHGIDTSVVAPLMESGRRFFSAGAAEESRVQVAHDSRARTGTHQAGNDPAADRSDLNEGLYFEARLAQDLDAEDGDTSVCGQIFLPDVPGFREPMLDYVRSLTGLAHNLMAMIARALRLQDSYFVDRYTGSPGTSFRIFHYPQLADASAPTDQCGIGTHSDRGLLTILKQDSVGGLELKYQERWIAVPDIPHAFVCQVGDMLERLTNGRYLSAAHRVRSSMHGHRVAMPFCFEPNIDARIEPIAGVAAPAASAASSDARANALPEEAERVRA